MARGKFNISADDIIDSNETIKDIPEKPEYNEKPVAEIKEETVNTKIEEKTEKKRTAGRPKINGETVRITLNLPKELYDKSEFACYKYKTGGRTEYIIKLIQEDMDKNEENYEAILKMMKQ